MTVTPGSRQILDTISKSGVYQDLVAAGARMLELVCGPRIGVGQAPLRRGTVGQDLQLQLPGRSGTSGDEVYLCSPATAAATALKGEISDPRELGEPPAIAPAPSDPNIGRPPDPGPAATRGGAKHRDRPWTQHRAPARRPTASRRAEGRVVIVVEDDVSTGTWLLMALWV